MHKMKKTRHVKTHTFKLGKYKVREGYGWVGLCDQPSRSNALYIETLAGRDVKALACQIHEALHAEGCADSFLHQDVDPCDNIARFLVRMGWVRECDHAAPIEGGK